MRRAASTPPKNFLPFDFEAATYLCAACAALVLAAVVWAARVPQPDILISAEGRHVGVRGGNGRLHLTQVKPRGIDHPWSPAMATRAMRMPAFWRPVSCRRAPSTPTPAEARPSGGRIDEHSVFERSMPLDLIRGWKRFA
jgi:hypothetical protein